MKLQRVALHAGKSCRDVSTGCAWLFWQNPEGQNRSIHQWGVGISGEHNDHRVCFVGNEGKLL